MMHAGALMLLVQPLYILAELITATAVIAPYSLVDNTISDLGATTCTTIGYGVGPVAVCSPWHLLVNGAFIVFGLLMTVGTVLLRGWFPRARVSTAALVLWVVSGLSSIGTGLTPLDQALELHVLVSLPVFLTQPLALLLSGLALRGRPGLAGSALALGAISLAATVAFFAVPAGGAFGGLLERLALWPGYVWLLGLGVVVLRDLPRLGHHADHETTERIHGRAR